MHKCKTTLDFFSLVNTERRITYIISIHNHIDEKKKKKEPEKKNRELKPDKSGEAIKQKPTTWGDADASLNE